jgi:hypothetical protein
MKKILLLLLIPFVGLSEEKKSPASVWVKKQLRTMKALTPPLNMHEKIIACTILLESRSEGRRGMYMVAGTIAQRMANRGLHATTICRQDRQFSCWNSGKTVKDVEYLLKTKEATYASLLARSLYMSTRSRTLIDVEYTRHADHYYSKKYMKTPPYWAFEIIELPNGKEIKKPIKPVAVVGNHVFYKLRKEHKTPTIVRAK